LQVRQARLREVGVQDKDYKRKHARAARWLTEARLCSTRQQTSDGPPAPAHLLDSARAYG
jgi:hypothetical protein